LKIKTLRIENLRNLASVTLQAHPELNFIVGKNGAGKTSILESLVVLSRGRSFRTSQAAELIGAEQATFRVFAETIMDDGQIHRLGLERSGKHWKARKNATELAQISQLTRSMPLILMEPNSHFLVSGTPEYRRKFLDWGVFHVEQTFLETWRRFSRALKQRNAALRNRQNDVLDSLDAILYTAAKQLSDLRARHTQTIGQITQGLLPALSPDLGTIKLEYQNGWGDGDYAKALQGCRERDLERGATNLGPHRADINLIKGNSAARAILSRGEQKTLSAALLLAQAELLASLGEKPLILLDDLASEFDQAHFMRVLSEALDRAGQVWVTGTQIPDLPENHDLFHVEHGALQEML
jgi:DNA replication and repair protein RecF